MFRRTIRKVRKQRALAFEPLERRDLLAVSLNLGGPQVPAPLLTPGAAVENVNVSDDSDFRQSEMSVDVNPTNPLNLAGFSHRVAGGTTQPVIDVYFSEDGGGNWSRTQIDSGFDGLSATAARFDPTIKFDSRGVLHIAYGVSNQLVTARSTDGGQTFQPPTVVAGPTNGLDKWNLAVGSDGLDGGAVDIV